MAQLEPVEECPLCSSRAARPLFDAYDFRFGSGSYPIVRCAECGLARTSVRLPGSLSSSHFSSSYLAPEATPGETGRLGRLVGGITGRRTVQLAERSNREREELLMRWTPARRLLEVGCGSGGFLAYLQARGWEVRGLETAEQGVEQCRARRGLEVDLAGDPTESRFAGERFPVVAMYHVLEHVPSPVDLLRQAGKMLDAGGLVVVEVPNLDHLFQPLLRGHDFLDVPLHVVHWTPRTLAAALAKADLDLLAISYRSPWHNLGGCRHALRIVGRRLLHRAPGSGAGPRSSAGSPVARKQGPAPASPSRALITGMLLDPVCALLAEIETRLGRSHAFTVVARRRAASWSR